ncbi:MAG: hypothetical protein QXX08_05450 [Candidatus Bathyarchaeia archaeon]
MSSDENDAKQFYNVVLGLMMKVIEKDDILFLTFEQLRRRLKQELRRDVGSRELREAIGALKSDGKIETRKMARRDIFYLSEVVKVYKDFLSKKK